MKIWEDHEFCDGEGWAIGGHAFAGSKALVKTDRYHYAVDGEYSVYHQPVTDSNQLSHDFDIRTGVLRLGTTYRGNIALIDRINEVLHLAVEWTGTFPLYFVEHEDGLLFSSHLRPLAQLTGKAVDHLGLLEFVRNGYTFGGRTLFAQIRRMLPGQSLRYSVPSGRIEITEESKAWAASEEEAQAEAIADRAWRLLSAATRSSVPAGKRVALMMSGGWDSRTLLAALNVDQSVRHRLICYSHGDTESRELDLVARIAASDHLPCRLEHIDARALDPGRLRLEFSRIENVVFPHWHYAGRVLGDMGVACATAGVYGEILGGHYGPSMLLDRHRTMISVARALIGMSGRSYRYNTAGQSEESIDALLRVRPFGHQWYLRRDFEDGMAGASESMNEDVQSDLARLRRRGIATPQQLVEAFVAEHRGSHYINAQLLSCRGHVDIALPFAAQPLLAFASYLPLQSKIHNLVNRSMLCSHAPGMLRFPMAATLVPAGWPLLAQEATRFVRRIYEDGRTKLYDRTGGRISSPKLGWVNFEFIRSGNALRPLIEDLQCDYWDRNAIEQRVAGLASAATESLYPVFNQLAKVYTADLLCR